MLFLIGCNILDVLFYALCANNIHSQHTLLGAHCLLTQIVNRPTTWHLDMVKTSY